MFGLVSESRLRDAQARAEAANQLRLRAERKHQELLAEYNHLVTRINNLGGEEFLRYARIPKGDKPVEMFTKQEIRRLIQLCHPDRHGDSTIAKDMTAKLLTLR